MTHRRAVLAAGVGLLAGCRSAPQRHPPSRRTASASRLRTLLDGLEHAVSERDRTAYERQLSADDPGFASTAEMIFDNLRRLQPGHFRLRPTGRTLRLAGRRAELLGADAYSAEVAVGWSVPGDRAPSDQTAWFTVTPQRSALRWAGTVDGPDEPHPTPLWWLEPTLINSGSRSTVIGGAQVDLGSWVERADTAARVVTQQLGAGVDWNRRLVVIIPSNERLLEAMLGVERGSRSALAAITWPDGSRAASAPNRIMINPAASDRQSALGIAVLLAHEGVHVATDSPNSPAPVWLVEGFADHVAYRGYPRAVRPAADLLLADVVRNGPPDALPADQAFQGSGDELELAYLRAWSACRYLAERYGDERLLDYYTAVDRGQNVSPAAQQNFDLDHDQLVAGWRDWLAEASRDGRI